MRKFRFYRDPDGRWYVDLPDWTEGKAALEMVAGADTMLAHLANGLSEVSLNISEEEFDGADVLCRTALGSDDDLGGGAFYVLRSYDGVEINHDMWLCDVMEFVFGGFPEKLYISKSLG